MAADARGRHTADANPWGLELYRTLRTVEPRSASEQAAYAKWLDQRLDREAARNDRLHGAAGVIPAPLWLVLGVCAVMIVGFMLLFADSGEPAFVQATFVGTVVVVIVATLLLIRVLDDPYDPGLGACNPWRWSARWTCSASTGNWSATPRRCRATGSAVRGPDRSRQRGSSDPGDARRRPASLDSANARDAIRDALRGHAGRFVPGGRRVGRLRADLAQGHEDRRRREDEPQAPAAAGLRREPVGPPGRRQGR